MAGIGLPEILIVLVIVLIVFGPKRLPQLGRSLGGGMREFKDSVTGKTRDEDDDEEDRPRLDAGTRPSATEAATPEPVAETPGQAATSDERVADTRS
jgi:sec-independent protein translocase protein TatA